MMFAWNRKDAVAKVFGDWRGQQLVLVGHVVRRSTVDAIEHRGKVVAGASDVVWVSPDPEGTRALPVSGDAMAVLEDRSPGEDVPATIRRLHCTVGMERLQLMRDKNLHPLLMHGLARLEPVTA